MSKNKHSRPDGLIYSTNKGFFNDYQADNDEQKTLAKDKQKLRVQLDSKQRAGKVVTAVSGFVGTDEDCEALGKQLKTKCGTGGSVKEGLILVQGDYKTKIIAWLMDWGYKNTK
ncbi:MAG: translation initiation factor [Phycisphaerales bacterium]|nr:translation initiation factor [Phycisphaerales bacterium]